MFNSILPYKDNHQLSDNKYMHTLSHTQNIFSPIHLLFHIFQVCTLCTIQLTEVKLPNTQLPKLILLILYISNAINIANILSNYETHTHTRTHLCKTTNLFCFLEWKYWNINLVNCCNNKIYCHRLWRLW